MVAAAWVLQRWLCLVVLCLSVGQESRQWLLLVPHLMVAAV